ncbi:MAG: hypothetical protein GTO00_04775 [Deltaproteobacteria bacterium]|nr:hypothetical protein [Deltaproteobacteria bacterium]
MRKFVIPYIKIFRFSHDVDQEVYHASQTKQKVIDFIEHTPHIAERK